MSELDVGASGGATSFLARQSLECPRSTEFKLAVRSAPERLSLLRSGRTLGPGGKMIPWLTRSGIA